MQQSSPQVRTVNVTRYITPLREGGSLPAIAEADDDFMYVIKFRGAGQGVKTLVAELIAGEVARALGLKVPTQKTGRREGDPPRLVANAAKANNILGWRTKMSDLPTILSTATAWHKSRYGQSA